MSTTAQTEAPKPPPYPTVQVPSGWCGCAGGALVRARRQNTDLDARWRLQQRFVRAVDGVRPRSSGGGCRYVVDPARPQRCDPPTQP
jgi:hypothetical protein